MHREPDERQVLSDYFQAEEQVEHLPERLQSLQALLRVPSLVVHQVREYREHSADEENQERIDVVFTEGDEHARKKDEFVPVVFEELRGFVHVDLGAVERVPSQVATVRPEEGVLVVGFLFFLSLCGVFFYLLSQADVICLDFLP